MTDKLRQAAEMAFEALKDMNCGWKYIRESHGDLYGVGWDRAQQKADDASEALRQALEQPEREWVGLTDEEILEAAGIDGADTWVFETAYAIEAKLKEKNT